MSDVHPSSPEPSLTCHPWAKRVDQLLREPGRATAVAHNGSTLRLTPLNATWWENVASKFPETNC